MYIQLQHEHSTPFLEQPENHLHLCICVHTYTTLFLDPSQFQVACSYSQAYLFFTTQECSSMWIPLYRMAGSRAVDVGHQLCIATRFALPNGKWRSSFFRNLHCQFVAFMRIRRNVCMFTSVLVKFRKLTLEEKYLENNLTLLKNRKSLRGNEETRQRPFYLRLNFTLTTTKFLSPFKFPFKLRKFFECQMGLETLRKIREARLASSPHNVAK